MQSLIIMAFRWRLRKHGYFNVSIRKFSYQQLYLVFGNEPLGKNRIMVLLSLSDMSAMFRV